MDLQIDLPEEILAEIFSHLPAKSVGKLRCLSKSWLNILSSQKFIKSHIARAEQESLILLSPSLAVCTIETIMDNDETVSRELAIPPGIRGTRLGGSCDGLVLLINYGDYDSDEDDEYVDNDDEVELFLANPITLEWVKIPDSPLSSIENYHVYTHYGIGFDSVRDDYTVVCVSLHNIDVSELFVEFSVYYMKTGVWKKIEPPPHQYTCFENLSGAYVNGAYHWMGIWKKGLTLQLIDALDLATEVFFEIPLPSGVSMEHSMIGMVGVIGGHLCVVDAVSNSVGVDVWIMKEYGVVDSWTKLITVEGYHFGDVCTPLCFLEERDKVVCVVEGPRLVVYDVIDGTSRDLVVDGMPGAEYDHGGTFVESLVSPVAICGLQSSGDDVRHNNSNNNVVV